MADHDLSGIYKIEVSNHLTDSEAEAQAITVCRDLLAIDGDDNFVVSVHTED